MFRLQAYGKINLALDVIRKRDDGYHEVLMIMQTVKLHDQIDLEWKSSPGVKLETNLPFLPVDENNLMVKAANLLITEFGIKEGVNLKLRKILPVSAGLGGGSSDAAAVLYGVNRMFSLGLTVKQLMERGLKIGADVPFCVKRGCCLSEGIGEVLNPIIGLSSDCSIVLAKPPGSVSTRSVYSRLQVDTLPSSAHPDVRKAAKALESKDLIEFTESAGNILETVTCRDLPVIEDIKRKMKEMGAVCSLMSGSGPTVFGIFTDKEKAQTCYNAFRYGEECSLARYAFLTEPFISRYVDMRYKNSVGCRDIRSKSRREE